MELQAAASSASGTTDGGTEENNQDLSPRTVNQESSAMTVNYTLN